MTHRKQILVLESEKLLASAIISLLAADQEYDVTSTTFDSLAATDPFYEQEAAVVILSEELLAANISVLMELADRHPEIRLIVLGLNGNKLHVFDKFMVQVSEVDDFLALLKGSSNNDKPFAHESKK